MSKAHLTMRLTPKDVQKILNQIDWTSYHERVQWGIQIPECHFYDGDIAEMHKAICPYWRNWLNQGRALYPPDRKGLNDYFRDLKAEIPQNVRGMDHKRARQFLRTGR